MQPRQTKYLTMYYKDKLYYGVNVVLTYTRINSRFLIVSIY